MYLFVEMYQSAIQRNYFSISTHITSFKKIGKKMAKIESKNKFLTSINAITLFLFVKIYPSAVPEHTFTISTLIPKLKKIGKGMPKMGIENQFQMSIKGRTSVLICQTLPICNTRTLLFNINSHSKFEKN